jgi:F420-non-reducing hydrogenase iron-sulfur subunit
MTMKNQAMRISLFYCSNSLQKDELDFLSSKTKDVKISSVSLPCSGKVNLLYLLKSIETGSDGVLLVTCKFGECKYLQGNYRAQKRIEFVDDLLFETGFGSKHVKFVSLEEANKMDTLLSAINELAETFRFEIQEVQE